MKALLTQSSKYLQFLVLLFSIALFLPACDKENDMPEPEPGVFIVNGVKWQFSCKINGELWVPTSEENNPFGGGAPFTVWHDEDNYLAVTAKKVDSENILASAIFVSTLDFKLEEDFHLDRQYENTVFKNYMLEEDCVRFLFDKSKEDYIRISNLDYQEKRISGTFKFSGLNECGDSIDVTEGNFDAPYQ